MEPLDAIIISPQVGHATLALEEDTTALVIHVGKDFFQQFDSIISNYNRNNFFHRLRNPHFSSTNFFTTVAGTPHATHAAGTSFRTTAPAPTIALSPISTPPTITALAPI